MVHHWWLFVPLSCFMATDTMSAQSYYRKIWWVSHTHTHTHTHRASSTNGTARAVQQVTWGSPRGTTAFAIHPEQVSSKGRMHPCLGPSSRDM